MSSRSPQSRILDTQFLLMAYTHGYFPMADSATGEIAWFSPDPRGIFDLENFKVPRSLRQVIRKNIFEIRINQRFEDVIRSCGSRKETWISEDIIRTYLKLHEQGFAHSVEAWNNGVLAGGLYGVAVGGAFFGESMFSRERNASKVALVSLVERLRQREFELLDTQWVTSHLAMFGAKEIPRKEYLKLLKRATEKQCTFV
ncbi:MAG: leucyl/phenylalanyl-tRNA--protein transferase [Ignavibacteriales bacterium]|nr:leucyl/phenylalanyl-tRNA--protein transferase [Ignavibacteriales bacterium]